MGRQRELDLIAGRPGDRRSFLVECAAVVDEDVEAIERGFRKVERSRPLQKHMVLVLKGVGDVDLAGAHALIDEAKFGIIGRLAGAILRPIERRVLHQSDVLLADTFTHRELYVDRFGIADSAVHVVPVGTDQQAPETVEPVGSVDRRGGGSALRVLFFGTALPLHGIEYIIEAVGRCEPGTVQLRMIGGSRDWIHLLCQRHGVDAQTIEHQTWVPLDQILAEEIPAADICLAGPFGDTPQATRVITGKTFEFLALAKPTIVGENIEMKHWGFRDGMNCLTVPLADAASLSNVIMWATQHPDELAEIGRNGSLLLRDEFGPINNAARIDDALDEVLGRIRCTAA